MFESVYLWELKIIHYIQELPFFEGEYLSLFWQCITEAGNPKWAFTVYFPLLFCIVPLRSLQMLMAAIVAEYANAILKWLLFGDRPYWYMDDHSELLNGTELVRQFPATCETGPGSPSGHVMVSAAVFYVLLVTKAHYLEGSAKPQARLIVVPERLSIWHFLECIVLSGFHIFTWLVSGVGKRVLRVLAYVLFVCLIALSRLYIAAHFPHQVLLGVGFGLLAALTVVRHPLLRLSARSLLSLAAGLLAAALVVYYSLVLVVGLDPDWSIAKAVRSCRHPHWVHMSTSPWSTLVRDVAALVGLAACQHTSALHTAILRIGHARTRRSEMRVALAVATLVAVQGLDRLAHCQLVQSTAARWLPALYALVFAVNVAQVILVIQVPRLFLDGATLRHEIKSEPADFRKTI